MSYQVDDPDEATCRACLAVLERHAAKLEQEKFDAVLARQEAALAARDRAWAGRAA